MSDKQTQLAVLKAVIRADLVEYLRRYGDDLGTVLEVMTQLTLGAAACTLNETNLADPKQAAIMLGKIFEEGLIVEAERVRNFKTPKKETIQ